MSDLGSTFLELDRLSDEDRLLRDEVHRFAVDVLRPAAAELDSMAPQDRAAPGSPFFSAMIELKKLGFHELFLPLEPGTEDPDGRIAESKALTQAIVLEELGWGSLGLATAFACDMVPFMSVASFGSPELKKEIFEPWLNDTEGKFHGCWAITEPNHGSDYVSLWDTGDGEAPKAQLIAVKEEGGWRLNGQKSAWVSSAPVATHVALHAQAGAEGNLRRGLFAVLALDTPGVTKGPVTQLLGMHDEPMGELFFNDVWLPDANVLVPPGPLYMLFGDQLLCMTSALISQVAVGVARAAFEEALDYARQRVQGGKVIAEHKNVRLTLYSMFEKVECARAYARKALEHVVRETAMLGGTAPATAFASPRHTRAAQILTKRIAFEVANDAVQIWGAGGLSEVALVEKLFRDTRCLWVEDGTLEMLALNAATDIVRHYEHETYNPSEVMAR
jgi:alkylation response protein AidB-like acyl-CoA dehydrogenase